MAGETTTKNKSKKKIWISLIVGVILLIAGGIGLSGNEEVNKALLKSGAEAAAVGIIEMHPDAVHAIDVAANAIDAAVQARTASPKLLVVLVQNAFITEGIDADYVEPIIQVVAEQVNTAYETSETELMYLEKATSIASGLRAAVRADVIE